MGKTIKKWNNKEPRLNSTVAHKIKILSKNKQFLDVFSF